MKKKAQLKIQEMSFILVAIILFFALAGLFLFSIYYRNIQEKVTEQGKKNAVLIAESIGSLPEFSCGELCVDADKLMVMQDRKQYNSFWPKDITKIEVVKIWPKNSEICNEENYPNCGDFLIYDSEENTRQVSSFVKICRKEKKEQVYEKCELGKILVGYRVE